MITSNELWISHKAKLLGYKLIKELNVGMGFVIASYLDVNHCYNNHQAVLVWLEHFLEDYPEIQNVDPLRIEFLKHFPDSCYALA